MGVDTRIHWPSPELVAIEALLSAIVGRRGRALDLGCGPGTEALFLASQGWNVVAVDRDAAEIGTLRARARKLRASARRRLTALAGDAIAYRERDPGTFELVHDRLLLSNLWGDAEDVYARPGRTHAANRRELIACAAWALAEGGFFVLRMRQWRDAVEAFEPEGGSHTLSRAELRHADRWFTRGPELGYLGFSTPEGPGRALKKLTLSIQVWRRNAKAPPAAPEPKGNRA